MYNPSLRFTHIGTFTFYARRNEILYSSVDTKCHVPTTTTITYTNSLIENIFGAPTHRRSRQIRRLSVTSACQVFVGCDPARAKLTPEFSWLPTYRGQAFWELCCPPRQKNIEYRNLFWKERRHDYRRDRGIRVTWDRKDEYRPYE